MISPFPGRALLRNIQEPDLHEARRQPWRGASPILDFNVRCHALTLNLDGTLAKLYSSRVVGYLEVGSVPRKLADKP
jgi:hypothetical protein